MNKTAPTRPPALRSLSVSLVATPTAPAEARRHVRAAIESWDVAADPYVAALLTSELVTNAIMHTAGTVRLFVTCSCEHLRVYVHDTSRARPVPLDPPAEAEDGRGLVLVDSLSTDWGSYRTSDGKAVYFTLAFGTGPGQG
jgi:anti-sigma regulatory factor (Ser/Thr protein kinase)